MKKFTFAARVTFLALLLLAILLSAGCAMKWKAYAGPELLKDKIAIIEKGRVGITKVDGKGPGKARVSSVIEVLPGEHTLEVNVIGPHRGIFSPIYKRNITFMAEAGHVYIVYGKLDGENRWIWIEDKENNEVVAGEKPQ